MCIVVDAIVDCVNKNYMTPNYSNIIYGNDRTDVKDFPTFIRNISNKLGDDFVIYKEDIDFVVFNKNDIYILVEYILMYFNEVEFNINMFNSMENVDKYLINIPYYNDEHQETEFNDAF